MTEEERMARAREIVATWPALTDQDCRELTDIAVKHRNRRHQEARTAPVAA